MTDVDGDLNTLDVIDAYEAKLTAMAELLPAWFINRMLSDNWYFGLLLTTGHVMCINTITNVLRAADGSIWLDVDMMDSEPIQKPYGMKMLVAPTSRIRASVNAAHVVTAFELADT